MGAIIITAAKLMENNMKNPDFGPEERAIPIVNGSFLVCQSTAANPTGTTYVRIVDGAGKEIVYWDAREWEEDPEGVMGAIMGAIACGGIV